MSEERPLVELIGIGKRYGSGETAFDALHDINLKISHGEFLAIMGPSGSGKSTCMNLSAHWIPRRAASISLKDITSNISQGISGRCFAESISGLSSKDSTFWQERARLKMWNFPCCTAERIKKFDAIWRPRGAR